MTVRDEQVSKLFRERGSGASIEVASLRSGMSMRTGGKYLKEKTMPSQKREPRGWTTRSNPFAQDWEEVGLMLAQTPDLQAKTVFDVLSEKHPDRYTPGQLRTLQRHIRRWHALQGDDHRKPIFFPQQHIAGEAMQGDFTHTGELRMTLMGERFAPLLCHNVLPFSKWQWATRCVSESILALRCGLQDAVFRLGRIPNWYQTDNSTGATHRVGDKREFNKEYVDFVHHLGMQPRTTAVGAKEQNGSIEASNGAFKRFLEQRLLVRGNRDFLSEADFDSFLHDALERVNRCRQAKFAQELASMRLLTASRAPEFAEYAAKVSTYATINIRQNVYSVPPRLTNHKVKVRVYEQRIDVLFAGQLVMSAPRLLGKARHAIDYRHVIWALVRKPGAFARYRYRKDLLISPTFTRAFDALQKKSPGVVADAEYLRLLHLAASTMQCEVETAIGLLLDQGHDFSATAVKALVQLERETDVPAMKPFVVDLQAYDKLLQGAIK
jgi:hypothetical protein